MTGRDEFLKALGSCERTSARLSLALDERAPDAAGLAALRRYEIECLATVLPAQLCLGDLERLKSVLNVGQEVWLKVLAEKMAATRNLVSLRRALQVTCQLSATRAPRRSVLDCLG